MGNRTIQQLVQSCLVSDGAGVTLHRSIGTPAMRNWDPFLMLDHFSSENPDDYLAGFPEHPHRGFNTFTYMLDGHMRHEDSMGNQGDLRPGGAQWMKAGSGVIHSEMPQQLNGLMRGFQLWINLPAEQKMTAPAYQEIAAVSVPEVVDESVRVRVLAGRYAGQLGPVEDDHTQVQYMDVLLQPDARFQHQSLADHVQFLYVFEGTVRVSDVLVPLHHLAVLTAGDSLQLQAGEQGGRMILVSGQPLGEPIVQQGPFVMNTQEQIRQAVVDYQQGQLVAHKANMINR